MHQKATPNGQSKAKDPLVHALQIIYKYRIISGALQSVCLPNNNIIIMQMGEDFISLFNQKYKEGRLWTITLTHSPDSALEEVWSRDINIIFGFFDSDIAREILCRVSYINSTVSSSAHACH